MEQAIRQTAYKVWISDLITKELIKEEGEWSPNYVLINEKKVSRVNIVANVIMRYKSEEGNYASLTIDDGSENIQVKAWREDVSLFDNVGIGNQILLIAKIKEYNSQIYLVPEIIRVLDKKEWIEIRKRELISLYGNKTYKESKINQENVNAKLNLDEEVVYNEPIQNDRQIILNTIEKLDLEDGANISEIISLSKLDEEKANFIINELLKDGEIFEIRTGRLKILE